MRTLLASMTVVALAVTAAHAGPLAPAPRIVATYERDFIERSGAQTLEELLDTGIVDYMLTGGLALPVLVNGRPYAHTSSDLDTLPLSAIERLELWGAESTGTLIGNSVRGALNVVLRSDLDGFETRVVARVPSKEGGEGWQGSAFWGTELDEGRMTVGVDVLRRNRIASRHRDHSRSEWEDGGSFDAAKNISVGGNTVWVVQRDNSPPFGVTGVRSVALGECDRDKGYTGPLSNPPGIRNGDRGCGFAYSNIAWYTSRHDQQTAIANLDYPITEEVEFHLDANLVLGESKFRYAPSVGTFRFFADPGRNQGLLTSINDAADGFVADANDLYVAAHRFVGHGNRDWRWEYEELDLSMSVEGPLADGIGYEASLAAFDIDGELIGNTFVHEKRIQEEIAAGNYDLANPFSQARPHLDAIDYSALQEEGDFGGSSWEARLALEGSLPAIGRRNLSWTAGIESGRLKSHDETVFRSRDGRTHDVSEVLGSGGASYRGERRTFGAFTEMSVPLAESLDLRMAGRADDYDDVGGLESWRLATEYRPSDLLTLRASYGAGEGPPPMLHLYSSALQDHPYVECDPGPGSPPRTCPAAHPRQVKRVTTGNPELEPAGTRRFSLGAEVGRQHRFISMEWYRLSLSDVSGQSGATWSMLNLDDCEGDDRTSCIERTAGDITIHTRYANTTDTEVSGLNTRFGAGFRTGFGVAGFRGVWRRVHTSELRRVGETNTRLSLPRDVIRVGFLARRANVSALWTINHRSEVRSRWGTGVFKPWTGHDLVLDWNQPLGIERARLTGGVFNVTDKSLSVNTANPSAVDGPAQGGWGRTFFLTLNMQF